MSRVHTARRKAGKAQKAAGHAHRKARKRASATLDRMGPHLESARDSASTYASDAAEWAQPHYEAARKKYKKDVEPVISERVSTALAASEPFREEALTRGTAALAALRGEVAPPKKKRRWGRRFLLLLAFGGAAAAGYAAWSKKSEQGFPSTIDDEEAALAGNQPATGAVPPVRSVDGDSNGATTSEQVDIRSGSSKKG